MTRTRSFLSCFALAAVLAAGCNAITGADDFSVDRDLEDEDDNDSGSSGNVGSGLPSGASGDPGTSGVGSGAGGGTTSGDPPGELTNAAGVNVTEIALYQAVKRTIMSNGSPGSGVPIVAGRDALVRVFVSTDGAYDGSPVTARLYVGEGSPPIEVTEAIGGASSDGNLGSTLNFEVPGAQIAAGVGYRLELGKVGGTSGAPYAYPASGFESLGAQSAGSTLKIVLVPVAYGADGSNRLPDTSAAQLARYENRFQSMYPVPKVEITVHANVQWNGNVSPGGSGWGNLLDGIAGLRQQDGAGFDVYYYGIFEPASSFGAYCGGGCVAGLGMLGGPSDAYTRVAIGLGFTGDEAPDTAVHEIGHTHGRDHAPCQVGGADPQYPHPGGSIGVWGYDSAQNALLSPNQTADVMGYCKPLWISDYTFNAVFQRIKFVNNASFVFPQDKLDRTYERVLLDGDGNVEWLEPTKLHYPPQGEAKTVVLDTDAGAEQVEGAFYPFDHLPGGILLVEQPAAAVWGLTADVLGAQVSLTR